MRTGIVGAGGIGGYLAAKLIAHGAEVALIARGAHGAAIAEKGLRLISPDGDATARPALVTDDPTHAGACDLVILAVKAHQLAGAIDAARPMMAAGSHALSFQNGVDAPDMIGEAYGAERALIGVARVFVNITGLGEITHLPGPKSFTVGDMDGGQSSPGAARTIALFRAAGIEAPDSSDVRADLWTKFLLFNAVSSTTAGARTTMGTVQDVPALWALFEALVRETDAVARASGVELPADAPERVLRAARGIPAGARASTAHDLEAGREVESDWICGAVARLGEKHNVPTPASRTIAALMAPYAGGS